MLTGNEIRIQVEAGNIVIEPFDESNIGPNSYDVRLGDQLAVYREVVLDAKAENRTRVFDIPEEGFVLMPGMLYLGKTVEFNGNPAFIPGYEGRSSLGRLGLSSHITAGFGDIGFEGNWTLEISVVQPVRIYPGMKIGQLYWHKPVGEITSKYKGKYQGQRDIQPSKLHEDWEGME